MTHDPNAAPQPSTAYVETAPSQEGVGQGEVASAAPTPETDDLAYRLWGTWAVPGEIEAFDLARSLERRLREETAKRGEATQELLEARHAAMQAGMRAEEAERRLANLIKWLTSLAALDKEQGK